MIIYYAHQLSLYDTVQECRDVQTLEQLGFEVLNPNTPETQAKCKGNYFEEVFKPMVLSCDALAFRSNVDLKIGAGAYKEVLYAIDAGIPVIELPSAILERGLTVEQTRGRLREMGQR